MAAWPRITGRRPRSWAARTTWRDWTSLRPEPARGAGRRSRSWALRASARPRCCTPSPPAGVRAIDVTAAESEVALPWTGLAALLEPLLGYDDGLTPTARGALRGALALEQPTVADSARVLHAAVALLGGRRGARAAAAARRRRAVARPVVAAGDRVHRPPCGGHRHRRDRRVVAARRAVRAVAGRAGPDRRGARPRGRAGARAPSGRGSRGRGGARRRRRRQPAGADRGAGPAEPGRAGRPPAAARRPARRRAAGDRVRAPAGRAAVRDPRGTARRSAQRRRRHRAAARCAWTASTSSRRPRTRA